MVSSNSSIDWTKLMSEAEQENYVKSPEFKEWLISILANEELTVTFTKKDGTEREMRCTRAPRIIPADKAPKESTEEIGSALPVFDLDKADWRSFIIENVKRIKYELK
jgi:hypothetical protein